MKLLQISGQVGPQPDIGVMSAVVSGIGMGSNVLTMAPEDNAEISGG